MKLILKKHPCKCGFDHGGAKDIVIARNGWPLERIIGHPIINFFRRILHGDHIENKTCWETRTGFKVA